MFRKSLMKISFQGFSGQKKPLKAVQGSSKNQARTPMSNEHLGDESCGPNRDKDIHWTGGAGYQVNVEGGREPLPPPRGVGPPKRRFLVTKRWGEILREDCTFLLKFSKKKQPKNSSSPDRLVPGFPELPPRV